MTLNENELNTIIEFIDLATDEQTSFCLEHIFGRLKPAMIEDLKNKHPELIVEKIIEIDLAKRGLEQKRRLHTDAIKQITLELETCGDEENLRRTLLFNLNWNIAELNKIK